MLRAIFLCTAELFTRSAVQQLLHTLLVSLDHLLDHLAADGAGFAGGQVTVVTISQIHTDFPWCPFYIVNDSDEEVRQAVDCQEQTL